MEELTIIKKKIIENIMTDKKRALEYVKTFTNEGLFSSQMKVKYNFSVAICIGLYLYCINKFDFSYGELQK